MVAHHIEGAMVIRALVKVLAKALRVLLGSTQVEVSHCMGRCAGNGTSVLVRMGMTASAGTPARVALMQANWENTIRLQHMRAPMLSPRGVSVD